MPWMHEEILNLEKSGSWHPRPILAQMVRIALNGGRVESLLGFGANNKKILPTQPRIAQDLSTSNAVMINGDSVM
jgi:hypothetical protein